jgi:uncharacterized protein
MGTLTVLFVMATGAVAGGVGALLGLGGGVFLVPALVLVLGLGFPEARGISLMTVIATSSAVARRTAGTRLINLRLAMVLEVATAFGGLLAGITAALISERTLTITFAAVLLFTAVILWRQRNVRNVLDQAIEPGVFGGRFHDRESGHEVTYRLKRMPVALLFSFIGGNVSGLLGIGGGIVKVPALNAWCGMPIRPAAAMSSFMIGVTAVAAAPIYYARGEVNLQLAAAAVVGVLVGSRVGLWYAERARARRVKFIMIGVVLVVAGLMLARGW